MPENKRTLLLTVITVTYNCSSDIEHTIKSIVAHKKNVDFEYLIIDGGSKDGTLGIFDKYAEFIDTLISESDSGIYDAMNKGWNLAKGNYVLFVNSGDILLNIPLEKLIEGNKDTIDLLCGSVQTDKSKIIAPSFDKRLKFRNTLPHQGLFYNRKIKCRFDLEFRVFSDFDLNQRIYKSGASFRNLDVIVCAHGTGGISHNPKFFNEVYQIIRKNYGAYFVFYAFVYHKINGLKVRFKR